MENDSNSENVSSNNTNDTKGKANTTSASNPFAQFFSSEKSTSDILNLLNQPLVANMGLGTVLYFLIDPSGLKAALHELHENTEQLKEIAKMQHKEISKLKKRIKQLNVQLEKSTNTDLNGSASASNPYKLD